MARVVREKTKVFTGNIGINTTSGTDISNSLNQISSAASNASSAFFKRADEIAQQEGLDAAKDLNIDQITTLDINTGKPVALSIPKTWGITRTKAFRQIVDKRFYASIENEIRLKSKEFSQKYKRSGNYLANYRSSMQTYLAEMHQNQKGAYAEFIKEVGSNTIAATEPNILSYLESKHIAQNNAFYKLERQKLLNAFVTADEPTKNEIMNQLYDLTQIQIELGEVPKNAHDIDEAATKRIATMQWSQGKVDDMNPEQIMRFQELLKAPFRTELLDEIGFTDAEKTFWNDNKQFLDTPDLNAIFTYGNHNRAEIERIERESLNDSVDNINSNASNIGDEVLKSINDLTLNNFDLENLDQLASITYADVKTKYPDLNIDDPRIAGYNIKNLGIIKSAILERYTAPIYGALSNDDEQSFAEVGGFDLVKNKSFLNNYQTLSDSDQRKYNFIVDNIDGGKEILDTLHDLYKKGVDPNTIISQFTSSTQYWTPPLTETQKNKQLLISKVTGPLTGEAIDTDSKEVQEIANNHINEAWINSIPDPANYQYSAWYNDPNSFNNEEISERVKNSFDKGILPEGLKNAIKSGNPSETALVYASLAQNHLTVNADGTTIIKNLLLGVEGMVDFNKKLAAVNSALTLGITSPIAELKSLTEDKIVEGTGKSLTSFTEGFNNINLFQNLDPNQPLGVKLNNQARRLGFGTGDDDNAYRNFKKIINNKLINESPVLLANFQSIGDYMLMVGTQIDQSGLEQMIDDYVEINTRKDGIVFDSFSSSPAKSIFGLELVMKSPEMAYAFSNSIEFMVNQSFFAAAGEGKVNYEDVPAYYFEHDPNNLTNEEVNNIFLENRVDWDRGNLINLSDDRVIARHLVKGGEEAIVTKYRNGLVISLFGTVQRMPGFYYKAEPQDALYDDKKSFENLLDNHHMVKKNAKKIFLIPLPNSKGRDINSPESVFELEYIVAEEASGGGLKPLINPTNGVVFTVNPKDFRQSIDSYNEIKKLVSLNQAEKKAYILNKNNADNPEWQKKIGPYKEISDKVIRNGIEIFDILNQELHERGFEGSLYGRQRILNNMLKD